MEAHNLVPLHQLLRLCLQDTQQNMENTTVHYSLRREKLPLSAGTESTEQKKNGF